MECRRLKGQLVLPVFYGVEPREIRAQRESYGKALARHEEKLGKDSEKVKQWRQALIEAANLSGWHYVDGDETKFIESIIKKISTIVGRVPLSVAKYPVGVGSRVEQVKSLLSMGLDDVQMIGIWGTGGIGKTTIAKAVYNSIASQFGGCSFLANVRETSSKSDGLVHLQKTLLSETLWKENLVVFSVDGGINLIRDRLCCKKILLVLDDVDHGNQLNALAGECRWFGKGSRIIITTRDKHVLTSHGIDQVYEVQALDQGEAFELLSSYAFPRNQTKDISRDLINNILGYANGLPLAIVVLGPFLCGRSRGEWESTLDKLAESPIKDINSVLRISFDALEDNEKDIFLDIACFFKGRDRDYVTRVLDSCGLKTLIGIQTLIERSLVTIESETRVQMHDLIQLMGQDFIKQECPDDPGKRSRLWCYDDVFEGTNAVKGIVLQLPRQEELDISPSAFTHMRRLKLLIVLNAQVTGGPICLPNDLRWLEWPECPLSTLNFSAGPKKLVWFDVHDSQIKELGGNLKHFRNLKFLNFRQCKSLVCVPDLSEVPNLETLNLRRCSNLKELPIKLKLKYLQTLDVDGCSKLDKFPDIEEMGSLTKLYLSRTSIKELPMSIGKLISVQVLDLNSCRSLTSLPRSIYEMQNLEHLSLEGCSMFGSFPENRESSDRPNGRLGFPNLFSLRLSGCNLLEAEFLQSLTCFSSLAILRLSGNNFVSLPTCISKFEKLAVLNLDDCKQLQEILGLPPNIRTLKANGCNGLSSFPKLPIQCIQSDMSVSVSLGSCHGLVREGVNLADILSLEDVREMGYFKGTILPGREIPCWFYHQSQEHPISFWVPRDLHADFLGLAICVAFGLEEGIEASVSCGLDILVNHAICHRDSITLSSLQSDHLWFKYVPRFLFLNLDETLETEWICFQISFKVSGATVRRCGFRLICKQAEDDLRVLCQHESPFESA
ncbi:hypothetical protein BT93_B1978 [Corymbia citriodora subsp. variegata]|nr:hypothetical protein BT93_B1978 [Corymbia citriodora subsp. variegata]